MTWEGGQRGGEDRTGAPSHYKYDIEDVLLRLGWDGDGKRRGQWIDVYCPFHDDRNRGNAAYNSAKNAFKCLACGVGGNSITLVMSVRRCSAAEAVEWLGSGQAEKPTPSPLRTRWMRL